MTLRSRCRRDKAFSRAEFISSRPLGKVVGSALSSLKAGESSSEDHLGCHQGLEWKHTLALLDKTMLHQCKMHGVASNALPEFPATAGVLSVPVRSPCVEDPVWHKYIQDAINHANNDPLLDKSERERCLFRGFYLPIHWGLCEIMIIYGDPLWVFI